MPGFPPCDICQGQEPCALMVTVAADGSVVSVGLSCIPVWVQVLMEGLTDTDDDAGQGAAQAPQEAPQAAPAPKGAGKARKAPQRPSEAAMDALDASGALDRPDQAPTGSEAPSEAP